MSSPARGRRGLLDGARGAIIGGWKQHAAANNWRFMVAFPAAVSDDCDNHHQHMVGQPAGPPGRRVPAAAPTSSSFLLLLCCSPPLAGGGAAASCCKAWTAAAARPRTAAEEPESRLVVG